MFMYLCACVVYFYPKVRRKPFQLCIEYFEFRHALDLFILMTQNISIASQQASGDYYFKVPFPRTKPLPDQPSRKPGGCPCLELDLEKLFKYDLIFIVL